MEPVGRARPGLFKGSHGSLGVDHCDCRVLGTKESSGIRLDIISASMFRDI